MEISMKGKVAAITGSTSGIGLGIAEMFAKAGADVAVNGFGKPEDIEREVTRLRGFGTRIEYFGHDLSIGAECQKMVHEIEEKLGSCDILINNAGIQHVEAIDTFPDDKWDKIIAVDLSSAFHTIKAAVPGMKAKGWGRIINIASAHGLVASPFKVAYVSAKHGMVGMTKCVALELAETAITCNVICPGFVKTPLVEGQIADQAKARGISEDRVIKEVILASQPTHRFVEVSEVAAYAMFLASDYAANITGAAQPIEGGWTAR
ncbi:MAG: 3-hydroxybutyrate dehydrogenase [Sphingomonadaceae bacterium]|nr:3-hydroxybutyrate dehydrogenase [Sphingomonadaceae bacterium]